MSDAMIRVEVAPGQTVTMSPHPSGLGQLGPLYLHAGERLRVTPARADQLYATGKILHPTTGQPRPAQVFSTPPLISQSSDTFESLAARADADRTLKPVARGRRSDAVDGWRDHVNIEPQDPNTAEQTISVGERRWQW